jgi:predicted metal-dependent peptidase
VTQAGNVDGLGRARLWAAARFPYLASGVFGIVPVPAPGIGTVAVDEQWRLWADPEVIADLSPAEFGSVLVHHLCHLLREHGARAAGAGAGEDEASDWLRSADAEINDDLIPAGLTLPGTPVLPQHLGCPPGLLAEAYYAAIRGRPRPARQQPAWNLDCGSAGDGIGRPWEPSGQRGQPGQPGLPPWQARLLRRLVAKEVTKQHGHEPGTVPAGLLRWANEVLQPVVDWRRALTAELRKAIADTMGAVDYSYRRPSRRASVAGPVVLPALRRPQPQVAVVCDTSGSMTDDLLAAALAEVDGLLRALGLARQLRVLACDTAAAAARRITSARQVELVGGGGTDMGAGIAAAAELRPRPSVTVVLTDGYTPWPDAGPKGMRVVVGLLGDDAPAAPDWARSIRVPANANATARRP